MNAKTSLPPFTLRRLTVPDAPHYRELRLEGLRLYPEAFGASWEDEFARPLAWFEERIEHNALFGGGPPASPVLAGVAGLLVPKAAKLRHKGVLWGMFVRPEAQGAGLGTALVARVIEHAAQVVEEIQLKVVASNTAALRLYARAGFEQYGVDRRALKVGDHYYDEVLMALKLHQPG